MDRTAANAGKSAHDERLIGTWNGFAVLGVGIALVAVAIWVLVHYTVTSGRPSSVAGLVGAVLIFMALMTLGVLLLAGLYTVQPNEAAILQLFGSYRGTTRMTGLRGTNPFYTRRKISLRARNLNGERLKVNDKRGNPIEIAAVVVWRVRDTAEALFEVDDYEEFLKVQTEAAIRTLTTSYEILGGPATAVVIASSSKFRDANPKMYKAFVDAFNEAVNTINKDKHAAAKVYLEQAKDTKNTVDDIYSMISTSGYAYTLTPQKVYKTAEFMYKIGSIKTKPASWKDLFFPEVHNLSGD